jgi:hypothetical protein
MLYREIIAACSQIHTKHINTLCGQNVEFLHVEPAGTRSVPLGGSKGLTLSTMPVATGQPRATTRQVRSSQRQHRSAVMFATVDLITPWPSAPMPHHQRSEVSCILSDVKNALPCMATVLSRSVLRVVKAR